MSQEILSTIMQDWPVLGVLLALLIGNYRLQMAIISLLDRHAEKMTKTMEKIADDIERYTQSTH